MHRITIIVKYMATRWYILCALRKKLNIILLDVFCSTTKYKVFSNNTDIVCFLVWRRGSVKQYALYTLKILKVINRWSLVLIEVLVVNAEESRHDYNNCDRI